MLKVLLGFFIASAMIVSGIFVNHKIQTGSTVNPSSAPQSSAVQMQSTGPNSQTPTTSAIDLSKMGGHKYADGNLPLGDNKYTTNGAKKGYIYLCNAMKDARGGGAGKDGPWIHGTTWNIKQKLSVSGAVNWPNSQFTTSTSGSARTFTGNDLPTHPTGVFPVQSTDPAYQYDQNPNSIKAQTLNLSLPANPTIQTSPSCIGGEVGIMLTGVPLFNGFDATLRDAAAHEIQDSCQGHPQNWGEYHYHSLSSCINNASVTNVIGYALDGFPITGPQVDTNKYLTTDDLDECHGLTSEITLDGKKVTMYHYVMTEDFPYSVSCFKGKPSSMQVISGGQNNQNQPTGSMSSQNSVNNGQMKQPPREAFTACSNKSSGTSCSFSSPNGTISGTCQTPPNQTSVICVPSQMPR